jgi:hypothetical protein
MEISEIKQLLSIETLLRHYNLQPLPEEPAQSLQERIEILTKIFESFKHGLRHPVSVKPKEYLKERNLTSDLIGIGYNCGQFHHRGKLSDQDQQARIKAGFIDAIVF